MTSVSRPLLDFVTTVTMWEDKSAQQTERVFVCPRPHNPSCTNPPRTLLTPLSAPRSVVSGPRRLKAATPVSPGALYRPLLNPPHKLSLGLHGDPEASRPTMCPTVER
ncbi:hypothetical protein DPEC_G00340820 [Dallia pectoralis]|uniref:Uncharacterized protein n=1 Tax=Dallia pectoralis TaxID=75939 RepID=A0ACC2F586_DALPE|nr:hypothetical protein DPEC_G00340820 [Dallia pectoralis]